MTKQRTRDNSYGNSVTMPRDLARPEDADATMLALCDSVGRRLRADGKTARVVTVQLVDNAFRRTSHQTTLPNPTNSTDRLYHVAIELMRQMWPQRPVRLVGVSAEKTGEVGLECGFSDASYFIKTFREIKHCTPREYRIRFC